MGAFKTFIRLLRTDRKSVWYAFVNRLSRKGWLNWLPDKAFLKLMYHTIFHKKLDLRNPQTFNEKMQWLKLYDRNPFYNKIVDKYEVKSYVAAKLGEEFIIPTLGVWDDVDKIDFSSLPERFVLKCTHDSGSVVICRDRTTFDMTAAKEKLHTKMNHNLFWHGREWPYKDVCPRIIAEPLLENTHKSEESSLPEGLIDYKFYCFNGEPRFLYVSKGFENHSTTCVSFLSLNWELAPYERYGYRPYPHLPAKPESFDKMIEVARILSKDFAFLRVDLYEINGHVLFSEMTLTPSAGFLPFFEEKHDYEIGQMLKLPPKKES